MKNFNLFSILFLAGTISFTSCKDKGADAATTDAATTTDVTATPAATSDVTAMPTTDPATATADPAAGAAPAVPTGPLTSIKFEEDEYDWGKVNDGDKMTHVFKFKNTGKEPLIISNAKGSCGCTVPDWPKDAIAPGKSGEIKVVFDSKGKGSPEGKDDSKKVTITANTDPADSYLTIKGKIVSKAEAKK
jgi:hypothetical protein